MAGVGAKGKARAQRLVSATPSRKVPLDIRRALVREAGEKCANPGCATRRIAIHHIEQWHVHKTHDQQHMIAVCPACHDQIHHGVLRISDDMIYEWKRIRRPEKVANAHLYVEPGGSPAIEVGNVLALPKEGGGMTYFRSHNGTRLGTRLHDGDILDVDLLLCSWTGKKLLEIVPGNHVRLKEDDEIEVRTRNGAFEVWTPTDERFLPEWLSKMLAACDPQFLVDGKVLLASISVARPSVVKIQGVWPTDQHKAIAIDAKEVMFYDQFVIGRPTRFTGQQGKDIKFTFQGDLQLERSPSFLSDLQLNMAKIFGKRNYAGFVPPFTLAFKDGSGVELLPPSVDVNQVNVRGPRDSSADFFKRFLTRLELTPQGVYCCHFQDGSKIRLGSESALALIRA